MFGSTEQLPWNYSPPLATVPQSDKEDESGIQGLGDGVSTHAVVLNCDEIDIGPRARFVGISNGVKLEVMNSGGVWIKQAEWTES